MEKEPSILPDFMSEFVFKPKPEPAIPLEQMTEEEKAYFKINLKMWKIERKKALNEFIK